MAYSTVSDVALGDLIDETTLNQILANLRALYSPPTNAYKANEGADYTITSTSFVDVDSSPAAAQPAVSFSLLLTLDEPGDVLIGFSGNVYDANTAANNLKVFFDVTFDGVALGGDDGLLSAPAEGATSGMQVAFTHLKQAAAAGAHTITLRWKVGGSNTPTVGLYAGAGTSGNDVHPQFWAIKV